MDLQGGLGPCQAAHPSASRSRGPCRASGAYLSVGKMVSRCVEVKENRQTDFRSDRTERAGSEPLDRERAGPRGAALGQPPFSTRDGFRSTTLHRPRRSPPTWTPQRSSTGARIPPCLARTVHSPDWYGENTRIGRPWRWPCQDVANHLFGYRMQRRVGVHCHSTKLLQHSVILLLPLLSRAARCVG